MKKTHWILLLLPTVLTLVLGMIGFTDEKIYGYNFMSALYNTLKLFVLNHSFTPAQDTLLMQVARWSGFAVFIMVSGGLFVTVIHELRNVKLRNFKNHIIVCGLNETSIALINRYKNEEIVLIVDDHAPNTDCLKNRRTTILKGDATDEQMLRRADIGEAVKIFAVSDSDQTNIAIAKAVYQTLTKEKNPSQNPRLTEKQIAHLKAKNPLKCYILVRDRELKNALEDTPIFKYKPKSNEVYYLDGVLFDYNQTGIHYGLCMEIDKIIESRPANSVPQILTVGLTDIAENVLLSLAHCLTPAAEPFHFHIVENDQSRIAAFRKKYEFLEDFIRYDFYADIDVKVLKKIAFSSVFVCHENLNDAVKTAARIRHAFQMDIPHIFLFSNSSTLLKSIFNPEIDTENTDKTFRFDRKNIHIFSPLEKFAEYIVDTNQQIETMAQKAHNMYLGANPAKEEQYGELTEHFKQSNRNQVLDNYVRTWIFTGKKLYSDELQDFIQKKGEPVFTGEEREILAMMEHRRWCIEKFSEGWSAGKTKNDVFKIHPNLCAWKMLSRETQQNDLKAIDLMIKNILSHKK